jgi:hypothetical protein
MGNGWRRDNQIGCRQGPSREKLSEKSERKRKDFGEIDACPRRLLSPSRQGGLGSRWCQLPQAVLVREPSEGDRRCSWLSLRPGCREHHEGSLDHKLPRNPRSHPFPSGLVPCRGHEQKGSARPIRMRQLWNQRHPDGQLALGRVIARLKVESREQRPEVLVADETLWFCLGASSGYSLLGST